MTDNNYRHDDAPFILDGYPRTVEHARKLDAMLLDHKCQLDLIIVLQVSDASVLASRLSGRWTHVKSGRSYHEKLAPPKVSGVDDVTGEPLVRRSDDVSPATVQIRLAKFESDCKQLVAHYKHSVTGVRCVTVDASRTVDKVAYDIYTHVAHVVHLDGRKYPKILLIGAPGSGKGTQGALLYKKLSSVLPGTRYICTGDLLRNADAAEQHQKLPAKVLETIRTVMKAGGLVDDDIMVPMLENALFFPNNAFLNACPPKKTS